MELLRSRPARILGRIALALLYTALLSYFCLAEYVDMKEAGRLPLLALIWTAFMVMIVVDFIMKWPRS